jgi:hypothetical protein
MYTKVLPDNSRRYPNGILNALYIYMCMHLNRVYLWDMVGELDQQLFLFLQNLLLEIQLLQFPLSIRYLSLQYSMQFLHDS